VPSGGVPRWGAIRAQEAAAADLPPLTDEQLARIEEIYDQSIRAHVHDRW
jgi:hypothetical protein